MQKNVPFRLECDLSFVSLFFLPFILVVECYFLHFVQLCASTPFHGACWGWLVYGISSSMLPSSVSTAAFSFFASFIFLVLCVLPLLSLFLCFQAPNVPPLCFVPSLPVNWKICFSFPYFGFYPQGESHCFQLSIIMTSSFPLRPCAFLDTTLSKAYASCGTLRPTWYPSSLVFFPLTYL